MRRKDREQSIEFGYAVMDRAPFGTLAVLTKEGPYAVALSMVRVANSLYFHCAKEGRKIEAISFDPKACVSFVCDAKVPRRFESDELDRLLKKKENLPIITQQVFTTEFSSAIVEGEMVIVEDQEEHKTALYELCKKYTPDFLDYFERGYASGKDRTLVVRIDIETVTAKKKELPKREEK